MSYAGKYALAKHETLALKCEDLERQLEEANKGLDLLSDYIETVAYSLEIFKKSKNSLSCVHQISKLTKQFQEDLNHQLKEKEG